MFKVMPMPPKLPAQIRAYLAAEKASARAADARAALPIGASRARVTTANARWRSAAEERDRLWSALSPDDQARSAELLRGSS